MTNICLNGPVVIFRSEVTDAPDAPPPKTCVDYFRSREAAEREAAKTSPTVAARNVHQQLADLYAAERRACEYGDG